MPAIPHIEVYMYETERAMQGGLRFCMVTTFYPPFNFGGDGVFVQRLSNELARRGHTVHVVHCTDAYRLAAPPPGEPYRDQPGVTVHGLKSRWGPLSPLVTQQTGLPLLKRRRIRQILDTGFDVIHFHNISLVGGPGVLALGNAIKLYTMHDYWLVCPTHALFRNNKKPCAGPPGCLACTVVQKRPPQAWRYSRLLASKLRHVDALIAPSLTSQRKHEQLGITGRIVHIPNFVSFANGDSPTVPAVLHEPDRPYFLFVGRLERLKGLHTVISAFVRRKDAELWIVGTGSEERRLRGMARGSRNVQFLGQQSGRDLERLYRSAIAVVYPSANFQVGIPTAEVSRGQGAPLVIMEAFSQRTPVIASRFGRIPALLEQAGGGLVYATESELQSSVDRLLADGAYRDELGRRGHDMYLRAWTADAHIDRYLGLIDQLAREAR
jgi:glycosyltransferase involved in cell wall biosynthesis